MPERFKIFIKYTWLLLCLITATANGQILKDTFAVNLIKKGIDDIYNMQFKNAAEVSEKIGQSWPGHPVVLLLNGMITYWENYPMTPVSPASVSYENDMRSCIEKCEKYNKVDEADYLLINLCARGMLLEFYADNELSMEVFPLVISSYQYIRRSFDFPSVYPDFNFFNGLYNYYREAYPRAYPLYRPLALLFPKGDMVKGLKEIQIAARNSIFLKPDSFSFLALICMTYDEDFQQASGYNKSLHELYPENIQYLAMFIKSLLLEKRYDEAERLIISSVTTSNSFYLAQLAIFNGILQEKKYFNHKLAQQYYYKGLRDISKFGVYGNEYAAYAYFGLSRISDVNGDKHSKKTFRKQAMDLADYKKG